MLTEFFNRLRVLFQRNHPTDLDDEFRFHVEQSTKLNVAAGLPPEEARRWAMVEFGAIESTREQCREQRPGWWLGTVAQDIRYALRGLRRNPVLTITVLSTLALGIGATTAVFSVVDRILFRPLPYAHDDRLVSVGLTAPIIPEEFMLGGSYYVWRDNQKPFEAFTSETGVNPCDLTEHNPARLSCASVEASFLPTLGISPLIGRNFLPEEDRPNGPKVALISYGLWQSHYARDPGVVNRLIDIDGEPTRVIGVLGKDFEMPTLEQADVVVPQALDEAAQRKADPGRVMYAFARLKPGITAPQAQAMLEPVFDYSLSLAPPQFRKEVHLRVRSIRDREVHDMRPVAWILLGAVLTVLMIACANVAGLLKARSAARQRELAVRSVLGASRGRLIRQTLTETLVLSLAGAALGCVLAEILLRVFISIAPAGVPFLAKAHLDPRIVLFTVLLSLTCGALFGIAPALERPRVDVLASRFGSGAQAWLRRWLVVGQLAASVVLLTGAALLLRSFRNLQEQNIGLQTRGVLAAHIELPLYRYTTQQKQMEFFLRAESAIEHLPGVDSVAVSDSLPPGGRHGDQIFNIMTVAGRPKPTGGTGGMVAWRWVTPEYFTALSIPIVRGRNFTEGDRSGNDCLIVVSSLLAARLFPREDGVGKHVKLIPEGPWCAVVGVAANVRNAGLSGADEPEYYRLRSTGAAADWGWYSVLTIKGSLAPAAVEPWVRAQIGRIDPTVPIEIETLSQDVSRLADRPRFETALLAFFALCGLAIALIGLYGVISFIAAQRTQEIGVRMALGATRGDILRLVAGDGVRLIAIGVVLGLGAAFAGARVLQSLLFNVNAHDPASFVAVALLLAVAAMAAALIPAFAAMKVEPVEALRYE
jgi:putative ABC transport system permease protein